MSRVPEDKVQSAQRVMLCAVSGLIIEEKMHSRDSGRTDLDRRVSNYPGPLATLEHRGRLGLHVYTGVFQLIQRPFPASILLLGPPMITHY